MSHGRSLADHLPISAVNGSSGVSAGSSPIDLTITPDFRLGSVDVRPSTCEVVGAVGAIRLQPRVMQVLVAVARAGGEVVSRKSLVEACWGDVVVGDDSLNRCIQRLRRLSQEEAQSAFVIETVPRLGYRLSATETAAPAEAARPPAPNRRYWPVLAGSLLVVTLLAIAASLLVLRGPARWSIERSEPLVSTPLLERHPALSPDGTMLAYSAGSDIFSRHIYLKRLSGGEPIQLTSDGLDDVSPTWSHDGSRVAYSTYHPGAPCRIMVVPVPAGLAREVGRCRTAERSQVVWNGSANSLLLVDAATMGAPVRIFSLDLNSGRGAPIDHPPDGADDWAPAVSPDGHFLSFTRTSAQASDNHLMIRDLRTGRETWVAHVPSTGKLAAWSEDAKWGQLNAWSEDSKSVFVVADVPGSSELWSYPIDGGPEHRLLTINSPVNIGRLSSGPGGLLAAEYNTPRFNLAALSAAGSPQIIDPASDVTWSPAFAPDGTLAMASARAGEQGVLLMRSKEQSRLLLSVKGGALCCIAWSPNGATFAYVTNDGFLNVRVVSVAGEEIARIRVPGSEARQPAWMADGRSIVFPVRDAGGWRLWRAELGRPDRPTPVTGYGWASVRTDGDILYGVRSSEPGIWRIGPPAVRLTGQFSIAQERGWLIFRHQIIFADPAHLDHLHLLAVPVDGGSQRLFADLPRSAPAYYFTINPRTGAPVYVEEVSDDTDIELFHLERR
jgi:Tol biopolymer transport system component/DNA-binding winged helix-turn-helix (wHTH) protein